MFFLNRKCSVLHENADLLGNSLGKKKDMVSSLHCIQLGHDSVFSSSIPICELWGFHSSVAENSILLGYDTASLGNNFLMFQRTIMPSCLRVKGSKHSHLILSDL
jgi:hypothetical protein